MTWGELDSEADLDLVLAHRSGLADGMFYLAKALSIGTSESMASLVIDCLPLP